MANGKWEETEMKIGKIVKVTKNMLAGMLVGAVIISGIIVNPLKAEAADAAVKYTPCNVTNGNAEIPVEKDYVFGGWYETANSEKPLKDSVANVVGEKPELTTLYAKMVPAYVLSVKMQINSTAQKNDGKNTTMRVLSAVDDTKYREVGFEVYLGNSTEKFPTEAISTVYEKLIYSTSNGTKELAATSLFGTAAKYVSAIQLSDIDDAHDNSKIYVRPYWVTLDGTKVQGMARNVHVMDEFENYISVPINILSGEKIAAGKFVLSYDSNNLEVVSEGGFEAGKLFEAAQMDYNVDAGEGKIRMVGMASSITSDVSANGLLANIRFKVKDTGTVSNGIILTLTEQECSNWAEQTKTVTIWDYRYGTAE